MSDLSHDAHTGPIKSPSQLLWTAVFSFVVPVFLIIGLVYYVTSANKPAAGAVDSELATAIRIQRVGSVELSTGPKELKTGEQVFKAQCSGCHATGALGSPKFQDEAAWAPRIKTGFDALLNSAVKGKGAMSPQVGAMTELEVARGMVYMVNAAGGKFEEPAAPAAAASAK
jgi:cytochrome c5